MLEVWIVNYFSADLVERCLASLAGAAIDRIFILDNSESTEQVDALEAIARDDRRIRVVATGSNLGFGAGMNYLASGGGGKGDDVIWILNPDTHFLSGDVGGMVELVQRGQVDVISPVLLLAAGESERVWYDGGDVDLSAGVCAHTHYGQAPRPLSPRLVETRFVTGAALMVRRDQFSRVGGFRDDLFLYWEDVDFSLRARAMGLRLAVYDGVRLAHDEGKTSSRDEGHSAVYYRHIARNRIVVCKSHGARGSGLLLGRGLGESLKAIARPLREKDRRWIKLRAAMSGMVAGIRGSRISRVDVLDPAGRRTVDEAPEWQCQIVVDGMLYSDHSFSRAIAHLGWAYELNRVIDAAFESSPGCEVVEVQWQSSGVDYASINYPSNRRLELRQLSYRSVSRAARSCYPPIVKFAVDRECWSVVGGFTEGLYDSGFTADFILRAARRNKGVLTGQTSFRMPIESQASEYASRRATAYMRAAHSRSVIVAGRQLISRMLPMRHLGARESGYRLQREMAYLLAEGRR